MTTADVASQSQATPVPAGATAPAQSGAPAARPAQPKPLQMAGAILALLAAFIVGFFVYLYALSDVSEARAQAGMFKNFVGQLQQATAPVTPSTTGADGKTVALADGTPVAVLNIPEIGLRDVVVVEGTTSRDLALGPGHLSSSALPGQAGISVLYAKAATYGAPFAHLMRLNRGDRFTVTTGQGTATYSVESFGDSAHPAPVDAANTLFLVTAAPSFWPGSTDVQVSADLVSTPRPNPGGWPLPSQQAVAMAGDPADSLVPFMLWSQALLVAVIVATVASNRWSRWATYLLAAPVVIALTWCVYENAACLLPNLY